MIPPSTRFTLKALGEEAQRDGFARHVVEGLTARPKRLACRYFYDERGSHLFEAICELPEYYLTRAERSILEEHAAELAAIFVEPVALVELGSGSAVKTRLLIEALVRQHGTLRYVPVDISESMLVESSRALLTDYPELEIAGLAAEYQDGLRQLRAEQDRPKLILWLGSNVGNLDRDEGAQFVRAIRAAMTPCDRLLIGIDLRKDRATLERAYDDAQGITAAFNLNLLERINRELGGEFDLAAFDHQATYNEELGRVEMYLVSARPQCVRIDVPGIEIAFARGEAIHTEDSYKYSLDEIDDLAREAALRLERQWLDDERRFSVNLFTAGR